MHARRRRRAVSRALLSALVLRVRDEPPGSSLSTFEGAGWVDAVGGRSGRQEEGRNGQQSTSDGADTPSLVPLLSASVLRGRDEPPGSSLLTFEGAGVLAGRRRGRRARRARARGQKRAAGHERQRGRTVSRAPALRFGPPWTRRASVLVAVVFRARGEGRRGGWSTAGEWRRTGVGSRARTTTLTRRRSCLCSPPPSCVPATSLGARRC